MKVHSWPAWFSYPMSWLKDCVVSLIKGFIVSMSFSFFVYKGFSKVNNIADCFILLTIAGFVQLFLFTFLHYMTARIVKAAITNLPSEVPNYDRICQWFVSNRCSGSGWHWREGLKAFVFLFLGFIFAIPFSLEIIMLLPWEPLYLWNKIIRVLSVLPISIAYCYFFELLFRRRKAEIKTTRNLDRELALMQAQIEVREELDHSKAKCAQLSLEVSDLKEKLEAALAENKKSALARKDFPYAANLLNQLKTKRQQSSASLADVELILKMIEKS